MVVCDAHSPGGLRAAALPDSHSPEPDGTPATVARCQPVSAKAKEGILHGVRARWARSPDGAGRELAWFPAAVHGGVRQVRTLVFAAWFRG